MRRGTSRTRDEHGFTLVELMVAAFVLVVGMLAILGMLRTGLEKTALNNQRVAATNFVREVTETARQVSYRNLTPGGVAAAIQAADSELGAGNPWTVVRRNTTFTVNASVCTFDDPADGIAGAPPSNRCADNPTTGAAGRTDQNGDDFRRITLDLQWRDGDKTVSFKQSALIANPSGGQGPRITSFTGPNTIITTGNTAHFDVTTTFAEVVHWNADNGTSNGDAMMISGQTLWSIDWDLKPVGATGAIRDGTYSLTAQASDDRGVAGDAKSAQVTINRTTPAAPTEFRGGVNTRMDPKWAEFEWNLNQARDIVGYRVFWAGADATVGTSDDARVCPAAGATPDILPNSATTCEHVNPPSGDNVYYVVAYDFPTPNNGIPRAGAPAPRTIGPATARFDAPQNLTITGIDVPTLHWDAPSGGNVTFYRIYRDGIAVANRIGSTAALEYTDHGAGSGAHLYAVSAVNAEYNESDLADVGWN